MTKGFVYLIEETEAETGSVTGFYKIGKTTNLDSRIRTFRTATKNGLTYRKTIEVDDYSEAETAAHKACAAYKMPGENAGKEWFDFRDLNIVGVEGVLDQVARAFPAYTYVPPTPAPGPTPAPTYSRNYSTGDPLGCMGLLGVTGFAVLLLGALAFNSNRTNYAVKPGDTLSKLEPGQGIKLPAPKTEVKTQPQTATIFTGTHVIDGSEACKAGGVSLDRCLIQTFADASATTPLEKIPHGELVTVETETQHWLKTEYGWVHFQQIKAQS